MLQTSSGHGREYKLNTAKAEFFDAHAESPWAALEYSPEEKARIRQAIQSLPSLHGQTVLEPGCGTGRLTRILAEQVGPQGRILAMDISSKMVQKAHRKVGKLPNVHLRCAAMEACILPGEEVDLVFCHQVFPHFDDPQQAAKIMAGCLRPGGRLMILHLIGSNEINDLHRKAGTAVARDMMPDQQELQQMLNRAGLDIEKINDAHDHFVLIAGKGTVPGAVQTTT
ncbi:2-polyprenyl-3-methyl-5-hydroxy-6-metoxy-1,4-benzoquinol methylase [Desulfosalsimonas propionicica]|uniref:2-polyprenyl-3-methyl-5-hydroxy-6-metoxy-1, 4-benzoquinol methylase n=1 Tax=Desulfosalsimonas propionicica TaxID=332175 RepID=A0A7W0CAF0_9BACT|nr:class I SAM-dependent methyltransferase [Desulfosalsimonas propionicica]MBA2882098.1 2-polyprenyl-3-methyl-5-hydroxy-6-metoxy-1,4-benzoquinol methylase [Desulfosalsimonas propionicica]